MDNRPAGNKRRWWLKVLGGSAVGILLLVGLAYGLLASDRRAWRESEQRVAANAAPALERLNAAIDRAYSTSSRAPTRARIEASTAASGFVLPAGMDPRDHVVPSWESIGAVLHAVSSVTGGIQGHGMILRRELAVSSKMETVTAADLVLGRGPAAEIPDLAPWCDAGESAAWDRPRVALADPQQGEAAFDFLEEHLMLVDWRLPDVDAVEWELLPNSLLTDDLRWASQLLVLRALRDGDAAKANQLLLRHVYMAAVMIRASESDSGWMRQEESQWFRSDGLMLAVEEAVGIELEAAEAIAEIWRAMILDDDQYFAHRDLMTLRAADGLRRRMASGHVAGRENTWTYLYDGKAERTSRMLVGPVAERELGIFVETLLSRPDEAAIRRAYIRAMGMWLLYNGPGGELENIARRLESRALYLSQWTHADEASINSYPERCTMMAQAIAHHRRTGMWPSQSESAAMLPEAKGALYVCPPEQPGDTPIMLYGHRHWAHAGVFMNIEHTAMLLRPYPVYHGYIQEGSASTLWQPGTLEVITVRNAWPELREFMDELLPPREPTHSGVSSGGRH